MSRSARLLDLLQALRRHRRPVSAAALAEELGVSVRTIYRDIATLSAQGASIEGEAGLGYVLKPGFVLPPLMFQAEEFEALILGLRFVVQRGDDALAFAASNAAAKIAAILPPELREKAAASGLLAGPADIPKREEAEEDESGGLALLREAIRLERRLRLAYRDGEGAASKRIVWPVAIGFFGRSEVLAAWCEWRRDFRHFRTDRIRSAILLPDRFPRRRAVLLKEWQAAMGIREQI